MNFKHKFLAGVRTSLALVVAAVLMIACGGGGGGGGGNASNPGPTGSGTGTLIPPPVVTGNTVPIVVDAGPVARTSEINIPYVTVTICTPGTTGTNAACQTIDHVELDTGSSGLRILNSALYSNLNLPPVTNISGQAIGECLAFAVGTIWGSVHLADIYLGGEVARSIPFHVIGGQPGGVTTVPSDCSGTGTIQDTQTQLGANGILGVGLFTNDCGQCLSQLVPASYYTCTAATGCTNSTVTSAQIVQNPVALFSQDNNGVQITLPAVADAGATSLSGSLIFGIGTQANNALGSATVYATNSSGDFSTTYNGVVYTGFIDSGSNALFFNDATIHTCTYTYWAYCPTTIQMSSTTHMSLSATNTAATGGSTGVVNFSIVNADNLGANIVAANIGGPNTSGGQFDWGLPFFFGRPVFTAISGASTPGGHGPYWAY